MMKFFGFLAIFALSIIGLYGICVFTESDFDDDDFDGYDEIDNFFTVFVGFLFATVFYSIILSIYSKRSYRKARKCVQRLIEKHNPEFASMGLRWNIPLSFPQWIELWKDYKGQNTFEQNMGAQPQHAYTLPIQTIQNKPLSQYPNLPPLIQQNSTNNQNQPQPNYKGNMMNLPLLAQQSQDSTVYIPPHQLNYGNYQN